MWLVGITPAELKKMPNVMRRVEACRCDRLAAPDKGRQKLAEVPRLFREINNPEKYIVVPVVSSENRRYVPMGFMGSDVICTDRLKIIPDAELYHFGILSSNVNMAWLRAVCGRLKSDYNYSRDVVYNNFPWPELSDENVKRITETAQGILDARELYQDSSLADLYDPLLMPVELRKAHQANDRAVMQAYGFNIKEMSEADCVAELMKMYQELVKELK